MKKQIVSGCLILALVIAMIPSTAFANEMPLNNTLAFENMKLSEQKGLLSNEDGTQYLVNLYESEEMIVNNNARNGETLYMKQYVAKLDSTEMTKINDANTRGLDNRPQTEWDSEDCVTGTVTIYYYKSGSRYLLTRASGYWTIYQSGTSIDDMSYILACNEGFFMDQYIDGTCNGSFDVTTNFTKYADSNQGICTVGARIDCKVVRPTGHSWDFGVANVLVGNIPSIQ